MPGALVALHVEAVDRDTVERSHRRLARPAQGEHVDRASRPDERLGLAADARVLLVVGVGEHGHAAHPTDGQRLDRAARGRSDRLTGWSASRRSAKSATSGPRPRDAPRSTTSASPLAGQDGGGRAGGGRSRGSASIRHIVATRRAAPSGPSWRTAPMSRCYPCRPMAPPEATASFSTSAARPGPLALLREAFDDLRSRRRLIGYLVQADVRKKGADTLLGNLWWVLDPLLQMARLRGPRVGRLPAGRTRTTRSSSSRRSCPGSGSESTSTMPSARSSEPDRLIRQVQFPKLVLPVASVVAGDRATSPSG